MSITIGGVLSLTVKSWINDFFKRYHYLLNLLAVILNNIGGIFVW